MCLEDKKKVKNCTSSLLIGSLKAVSITFFVGTIFHVGMTPESLVKMLVTIGGGFSFSAIWHARNKFDDDQINQYPLIEVNLHQRQYYLLQMFSRRILPTCTHHLSFSFCNFDIPISAHEQNNNESLMEKEMCTLHMGA
jgi:hypothetical protein